MNRWQYFTSLGLGVICLFSAIYLVVLGRMNQALQAEVQQQQASINRGSMSQQVGQNVLKDLAELSVNDSEIKDLLAKHGFTVNAAASPTP